MAIIATFLPAVPERWKYLGISHKNVPSQLTIDRRIIKYLKLHSWHTTLWYLKIKPKHSYQSWIYIIHQIYGVDLLLLNFGLITSVGNHLPSEHMYNSLALVIPQFASGFASTIA